jgi:hypothetical protein
MADNWRWQYFKPEEVLSPDGLAMLNRNNLKLQADAMNKLVRFREKLGLPISVNHSSLHYRGYRSEKENKKVGGVIDSPHSQGIAFDQTCYDMSLAQFAMAMIMYTWSEIRTNAGSPDHKGFRAIGIYPSKNFCHGDFRSFSGSREDYIVVWNGDNQKTILLDKRGFSDLPEAVLYLLQKQLALPNKWSV